MPYTPPVLAPSGTTFAQFQAGGFRGQLDRLATASGLSPAIRSLVVGDFSTLQTGIRHVVDSFLQGDPTPVAEVNARLLTYATALKALQVALDEINVLIDANAGTLVNTIKPGATNHQRRRVFP